MSRHPLQTMPDSRAALLPPQLFGTVGYYALAARYAATAVDYGMRYDKRFKSVHRYAVADTRGRLELTVPVSKDSGTCTWAEVRVSAHGRWWEVHRTALESAYGRTPYFEFYIDRLLPLFAPRPLSGDAAESVAGLCRRADGAVRGILGLPPAVEMSGLSSRAAVDDYRRTDFAAVCAPQTYWQVRRGTLGFVDRLSVLDIIFSLGPEAPLFFRH